MQQIRDGILRTVANGLRAQGIANPNVAPGSDAFIRATGLANELAPAYANTIISSDRTMPDTAIGPDLARWMAVLGLSLKPAAGSAGLIRFSSGVTTAPGVFIATGATLTDTSGQIFEVTIGGDYYDGKLIPIDAISVGASTDHNNSDTLQWTDQPPYSNPIVFVGTLGGTDGLSGGADPESDDDGRARLLEAMQNPPAAGNWSQLVATAQASTPIVEKGFAYPAIQGPSTGHYAVTARATTNYRGRDLAAAVVANIVEPYVAGLMDEHAYLLGTPCTNVPTDVAVLISLPSAPTASPPGPGGGWLDGAPWPQSVGGTAPCRVTSVTSTTVFTVNATTPPIDGASRIAYLSNQGATAGLPWTLYSATVVSHTGTSGAYVVTISAPFVDVATNSVIFPQSQNQAIYVAALLSAFAGLGPGEKTANGTLLQRSYRRQLPTIAWPYSLGATQLKQIINSGSEVLDALWLYRSVTTPAVPGSVTSNPNILTPQNCGFYAQ